VAVYANRIAWVRGSAQAMRRRAEIVERSFAHNLDRGGDPPDLAAGMRKYPQTLVHLAGHNLGILMRLLIGAGTPGEAATTSAQRI
jgi:hypothetical protein